MVNYTSRLLSKLHMRYKLSDALEGLKKDGATAKDFQRILDSYHQGNYKTHLEAGTLDKYNYGLLVNEKISKPDFIRTINKVYGANTMTDKGVVDTAYTTGGVTYSRTTNKPLTLRARLKAFWAKMRNRR